MNFIPLLFTKRETIEIRVHQGTVNKTKAINWFFICLAIIKYAEQNSTRILTDFSKNYTFREILTSLKQTSSYPIEDYLYAYFLDRKEYYNQQNLIDSPEIEYNGDDSYTFSAFGITDLC